MPKSKRHLKRRLTLKKKSFVFENKRKKINKILNREAYLLLNKINDKSLDYNERLKYQKDLYNSNGYIRSEYYKTVESTFKL
jgi:hypothetical protein